MPKKKITLPIQNAIMGRGAEKLVARGLRSKGFKILYTHTSFSNLPYDIIAKDRGGDVYVLDVKTGNTASIKLGNFQRMLNLNEYKLEIGTKIYVPTIVGYAFVIGKKYYLLIYDKLTKKQRGGKRARKNYRSSWK